MLLSPVLLSQYSNHSLYSFPSFAASAFAFAASYSATAAASAAAASYSAFAASAVAFAASTFVCVSLSSITNQYNTFMIYLI